MAILKCKMCGGDLNIVEGSPVCECEFCGATQTVPQADNEKKAHRQSYVGVRRRLHRIGGRRLRTAPGGN